MKRLNEQEVNNEKTFLQNASAEQIRAQAVFHDEASAFAALGVARQPNQRPVIAWVRVVGGFCPVGAVPRDTEGGLPAGCFNGGELIGREGKGVRFARHGPVVGGERTCVNCRWFITSPAHLPELMAMFELAQYKVFEADERAKEVADRHHAATVAEDLAHAKGESPRKMAALQRIVETSQEQSDAITEQGIALKVTVGNTYRLIQRCVDIANHRDEAQRGDALVMAGGETELAVILEATTSEMLQLARVSKNAEVFPELDPGKAILKCSEIMARKLSKEGVDPFLLLNLTESERCRVTNAVMQELAKHLNPNSEDLGLRAAAKLIEGPETVAEALGIKKSALTAFLAACATRSSVPLRIAVAEQRPLALLD